MIDWSNKQKEEFIKGCNIPVSGNPGSGFRFAIVKHLIKPRLDNQPECFGNVDPNNEVCKQCYLCENGDCLKFKEYLQSVSVPKIKVEVPMENGKALEKIGFRSKDSMAYKIANLILESNGKEYDTLINDIVKLYNNDYTFKKAEVRFYQIRKKLIERLGVKIDIEIKKTVKIHDGK